MSFATIQGKTLINGFSLSDANEIISAMKTAYENSATAKKMMDDWVDAGNLIQPAQVGLNEMKPNKNALINETDS